MSQTAKNVLTLAVLIAAVLIAKRGPLLALVNPSPINEPGLHVLIVEDTAHRTPELAAVINGRWQETIAPGNWRILDGVTDDGRRPDFSALEPKWQRALEAWPGTVPYVIVSNAPHGGEAKPLEPAELVPTIEKWSRAGQ